MEDLKAYIESGILELYAMGDLSHSERQEVELMLKKHPELRYELSEIEKALTRYAEIHSIEPDASLKDRILGSLEYNGDDEAEKMLPMKPHTKHINYYKYAFAASVALLLLSVAALISMNRRLQESNNKIAALEASNIKYANQVIYKNKELSHARQVLDVFQKPQEYKMVQLKGLPIAPGAKMRVAFNPAKSLVMIDLASLDMPLHDESHQYQLWALVDGKPVDLGVFDAKADSTGMIKMKPLRNAQAFAVTLEPKGGSINPTLEQMMVMGSI